MSQSNLKKFRISIGESNSKKIRISLGDSGTEKFRLRLRNSNNPGSNFVGTLGSRCSSRECGKAKRENLIERMLVSVVLELMSRLIF